MKKLGIALIALGIAIAIFSPKIVFPGLERLIGIEAIVGRQNVAYEPDGSYAYTNPGAMITWITAVSGVGVAIVILGIALLRKEKQKCQPSRPA